MFNSKIIFKSLQTFNDTELQYNLRQLDIAPFKKNGEYNQLLWNKQRAISKIKKHFNRKRCSKKNEILVFGYCHEMERLSQYNIPDYLIRIVIKYAAKLFVE